MDRKKNERELEKLKDQYYANEFNKKIEEDFKKHDELISQNRQRNTKILDHQFHTVIEDANNDKKNAAVENMKRTYE